MSKYANMNWTPVNCFLPLPEAPTEVCGVCGLSFRPYQLARSGVFNACFDCGGYAAVADDNRWGVGLINESDG